MKIGKEVTAQNIFYWIMFLIFVSISLTSCQSDVEKSWNHIQLTWDDVDNKSTVDFDGDGKFDIQANTTTGSGGTFYLLTPINGAAGQLVKSTDNASITYCEEIRNFLRETHLTDFPVKGSHACVVTSQGRIVLLAIGEIETSKNTITLSWTLD